MSFKPRLPIAAWIAIIAFGIIMIVSVFSWYKENSIGSLTLNFKASVGGRPLVFNQINYPNPGGDGKFKIRDFQFYLSNIKLISDTGQFHEQDSYHLARFDNDKTSYSITLDNIPRRDYQKIEFSIGVDKEANSSIMSRGDLDPNSRMAWSWDVGYKFILFEGGLALGETLYPLVYHVGFHENYRTIDFDLERPLFSNQFVTLDFNVDIMKIFNGSSDLNMAALTSIKFDHDDAKFVADNYQKMISLSKPTN